MKDEKKDKISRNWLTNPLRCVIVVLSRKRDERRTQCDQHESVKAAIVGAGMSQIQLAKAIGMNKNTLSAKINGKATFNVDEVMEICKTLGIQSDQEKCLIFLN